MTSIYEKLSKERKQGQLDGTVPEWYTTAGYQLFKEKYLHCSSVKEQFEIIAATAAKHLRKIGQEDIAKQKFFELLWNGWLSPSTPVLSNMGTKKGLSVSCSGGYIDDSVDSFYTSMHENAMLTKNGFGTSSYLGEIRPRGSKISAGGTASGALPVFKDHIRMAQTISQGSSRRGAWAGYIEIDHGDFDELVDFVSQEPDDANIGWILTDEYLAALSQQEPEAVRRYQRAMKLKMVQGKGYFIKIDEVNRKRPAAYVNNGLTVKASNLCSEVLLFSDKENTFTCVLSSMNIYRYDEWKDTDAVFWATVFLDCVAEDFLVNSEGIPGLERARRFTQKGRALGLGQMGLHSYFQKKMLPFESYMAHSLNIDINEHIHDESLRASQWMAKQLGEPEWCQGTGLRNTHRTACAPTKSTAAAMGGMSEGINPDPGMTYTQTTAGGSVDRITPVFLELLKSKGIYDDAHISEVSAARGSVQNVDWLTDDEKDVFKTAFEINQEAVIRLAASRTRYLCQWQSLNLFFGADEDPKWISHIHKQAFENPNILGLYYLYTQSGVTGSKDCESCS